MDEFKTLTTILASLGFSLDERQPYVSGERYLMAGGKLVLAGTRVSDGTQVIIKASRIESGIKEIESEKKSRDLMQTLAFANKKILIPEELYFGHIGGYVILVMRFIQQDVVFAARPLEEQFFIALNAFESQESFHATTFEHMRSIKNVFPILTSKEYLADFKRLKESTAHHYSDTVLQNLLTEAEDVLQKQKDTIDRYASYLTHTDFVPHNFRLHDRAIYMLDCVPNYATVHFGNKYEGWARFLNYMALHSPALEKLLTEYLRKERGEDEYLALRLMRMYKIAFLLDFYARALAKTTGDLHELTTARITYWQAMLRAVLDDQPLPDEVTFAYRATRDRLRSAEEKERQRDFAIA